MHFPWKIKLLSDIATSSDAPLPNADPQALPHCARTYITVDGPKQETPAPMWKKTYVMPLGGRGVAELTRPEYPGRGAARHVRLVATPFENHQCLHAA